MGRKTYHHGDLKHALVKAGTELLSKSGVAAFSLREVALKAGVSHAAPYAHFKDKQALIAAISTEGYRLLFERMERAIRDCPGGPRDRLLEAAWAYVDFAVTDPDHFSILFSGMLENEKGHPEYVEMTRRCYGLLLDTMRTCQDSGALPREPEEIAATRIWCCLHGFASLFPKGQISHTVLGRVQLRELVGSLVFPPESG